MADNDIDAELILDRLVSASTSEDAETALDQILAAEIPITDDAVWTALLSIFHDGSLNGTLSVMDGRTTAGRILLESLQTKRTTASTLLQVPGRMLESCIDVACSGDNSTYARILALQILRELSSSPLAQSQWLDSPNGLHRMAELLRDDETVQTETLALAQRLAQWSAVAKLWMFAEMGDTVVQTALAHEGLTGGSVTVDACLQLLLALVSHDAALADLVVAESPVVVPGLCQLLDLRAAQAFRYPNKLVGAATEEEDLDALLSTKSSEPIVPYLLESEEKIIRSVFSILETVLENESLKETVWKKHKALGTFIWDMALLGPPPPGQRAPCGVPSIELRAAAFQTAARYFHSFDEQPRGGWDRLLGAICTSEDPRLSHGALHLLRRTCTDAAANEILLQGLAPTMSSDQQQANVVQKLLNTILEQLHSDNKEVRAVLVVGALFALSVFLTDEARRSILFKISMATDGSSQPESRLLLAIFAYLERASEAPDTADPYITWHVWRFLAIWMQQAPDVVQAVLTSAHAPLLVNTTHPVARLCLGLAALHGGEEGLCGGWTRSSLLQAAQPWSRWTASLESLKTPEAVAANIHASDEVTVWREWVTPVVLEIRQALVQEMTASAAAEEDDGLGRVVSEQRQELEELRVALQEAQHRVAAQDNELNTWRRRVESNPTQLDQLLNDSTSKISQLEQTIASLRTQQEETAAQHEQTVKERDQQLVDVQQQLTDAQEVAADANTERDTLRDDMAALSQAYTSLETEFRAAQQQAASSDHQPEGEESAQSTTTDAPATEVGTLRAENARLQDDLKNANEWMATAYEKMNELNAQNQALQSCSAAEPATAPTTGPDVSALQTELESLRVELEERSRHANQAIAERDARIAELEAASSSSPSEEIARLQQDNAEAQKWMSQAVEHHQLLTEQVNSLAQENEELKAQMAQGASVSDAPSHHGDNDEILRLREEIEAYRAHKESMASLDQDLQSARSQCDVLRAEIVVKDQEIQLLASNNIPRGDTADESMLHDEISRLQSELNQSQTETSRSIEELTEALERIASLEARVSEVTAESESRLAQIQSFDVGLTQNHDVVDPSKLQSLEDEKEQLQTQLRAQKEDAESVILQWQESYGALKAQNDEMQAELQRHIDEAASATESNGPEGSNNVLLEEERLNFATQLEAQKEEAANVILQWQESHGQLKAQNDELEAELRTYVSEVDRLKKEVAEHGNYPQITAEESTDGKNIVSALEQQLENFREQLSDQERDASETIAQWQETYDTIEEKLRLVSTERDELSARDSRSQQEVAQLGAENAELLERTRSLNAEIAELTKVGAAQELELSSLRESATSSNTTTVGNEQSEVLQSTIQNLEEQLRDQIEESQQISSEWEVSYATQTAELEDCKATILELEEKLRNVEAVDNEIMENMDSEWQQKFEEKQVEIEAMREELVSADVSSTQSEKASDGDLVQKVSLLEHQLLEEKEANKNMLDQWEESYYDLAGQLDAANERLALLDKSSPGATEQAPGDSTGASDSDHATEVLQLRDEIARLREMLTGMEHDESANDVGDLQHQLAEAQSFLLQWEESYNDVKSQLEEVTSQLKNGSRSSSHDEAATSTELLASDDVRSKLIERERELELAQQALSSRDADHATEVAQLREEISRRREMEQDEYTNADSGGQNVDDLQEQLAEAESLLVQWEDSYNGVKAELAEVSLRLQNSTVSSSNDEAAPLTVLDAVDHFKANHEAEVAQLREEISRLQLEQTNGVSGDEDVRDLHEQLDEAQSFLVQWEASYNDVKAELEEVTLQLQNSKGSAPATSDETEVAQLRDEISRLRELEQTNGVSEDEGVRDLQEQLAEAQSFLVQWEASYNEAKAELEEVTLQLQNATGSSSHDEAARSTDLESVDDLRLQLIERQGELELAQQALSSKDNDHTAEVAQLREEITRLHVMNGDKAVCADTDDEDVRDLREQLAEARSYLIQWEESYNDVKSQLEEVTAELPNEARTSRRDGALADHVEQESLDDLKVKLLESENELEIARQTVSNFERESWQQTADNKEIELQETIDKLETRLEEEKVSCADLLLRWEESYNNAVAQLDDATESLRLANDSAKEIEHLNASRIASLEQELATARESLLESKRQIETMNENLSDHAALVDKVAGLEEELGKEKSSSAELLSNWEASYYELNSRFEEVSNELKQLRDDGVQSASTVNQVAPEVVEQEPMPATNEQGAESGVEVAVAQNRTAPHEKTEYHNGGYISEGEHREKVASLESQINDEQELAKETIAQWEASYYDVSAQLDEANEQLQRYMEEPRDSEDLERELKECKEIILQWQDSYASLQQQLNDSMSRPDPLPEDVVDDSVEGKAEVSVLKSQLQDLQNSAIAKQADWDQKLQDKERELTESQKQIAELLDSDGNDGDIVQQLQDATDAVLQWEAAYQELESQLSASHERESSSASEIAALEASALERQQLHEAEISEAKALLAEAKDEFRAHTQDGIQVERLNKQLLEERDICAKWSESYDDVVRQLEKANEQITELNAGSTEADRIQELERELEEAQQIVGEWEQSYTDKAEELQSTLDLLAAARAEIESLQTVAEAAHEPTTMTDHNEAIESAKMSQNCLEKLVLDIRCILADANASVPDGVTEDVTEGADSLIAALKEWIASNNDLVAQWESCYNDLDSQLREANGQIETLRSEVSVAEAALAVFENGNEDRRGDRDTHENEGEEDLLQKIESLEAQLVDEQKEAAEIVEQWQTRAAELEEQLAAASNALAELEDGSRQPSAESSETLPTEINSEIARLKAELSESNEASRAEIKKWEDEFTSFQKEAQEVINQWRDENENLGSQLEQSLEQNELHRSHIEELRSQLDLAQKQIESDMVDHALEDQEQSNIAKQLKSDLDAAVRECAAAKQEASDLREAMKSREIQVEDLKAKVAESTRRSSEMQSQAIESYVEEYLETIKRLEREVSLEKNEKRLTEDKLMQTNEQFKAEIEAMKSENAVARQTIEAELAMYHEKLDTAEESLRSLKQEKARMEDEFAALKSRNEELMDEVQGATAALQISASERASERANDVAISILKRQIEDLHAQLEEEHSCLVNERTVRAQSEAEVGRLQANLTALLGLENTEHNRGLIEQRLVEATESFQRTERSEILNLKQSLERALQDLASARASQKEKEEQAAKATYQSSLYEQELVKTKGDFDFLAQSMEELRQADDSKIASLEYRLSSLCNEQSVQRKYHAIEMDKLRNELSQINMERDRLIQALKDSEKNREAVLQASTRDQKLGNDSDALAELARLRVEKAQLLAATAEEAARTERKLRETRAASMAACEADVLLEKELRLSAEKNLASTKAELEDMRATFVMSSSVNGGTIRDELDSLREELNTTKQSKTSLENKVETMADQLVETERKSKSEIARMTEECRKALARAAHLEREGRLEAEVIAEAARLRQEKDSLDVVKEQQPASDDEEREKRDRELELVGVIENQTHEFAQERSMYFNTFANMEDMHVFIAQQDILTNILKDSLSQEAGRESLERAIREAEDKVKTKYGTYVKLS